MNENEAMYVPLKRMLGHNRPHLTEEKIREIVSFVNGVHLSAYTSYIIDASDFSITQVDLTDVQNVLHGVSKNEKRVLSGALAKISQGELQRVNSYMEVICDKILQSTPINPISLSFVFNLRMQYAGHQLMFDQMLIPLACFSNGYPCFFLYSLRVSPLPDVQYLICRDVENKSVEVYMDAENRWQTLRIRNVTKQEKFIMRLSMQGFSIKQIADRMHLSEAAVKKIRRQLFAKLQVQSITHAVAMLRYLNI